MSLGTLLNQRLTVIRVRKSATVRNRYGDLVEETSEVTYLGRLVQVQAKEVTVGADVRISDWQGMLPAGADVDATDRIRNEAGHVFEVIGPPSRGRSIRGESHVEFRARYIEGA